MLVSITAGGNPTLGQPYTLTCNVSVASGVTGTPTVQWVGPRSSAPITTGGDFTVSSTPPHTLMINTLRPSHAGQYTCRATVGGDTGTASVMVENIPGILCQEGIFKWCMADESWVHVRVYLAFMWVYWKLSGKFWKLWWYFEIPDAYH